MRVRPLDQERLVNGLVVLPTILLVSAFAVVPLVASLFGSLQRDQRFTLENVEAFFTQPPYLQVLATTLLIVLVVTVVSVILPLPACTLFAARRGPIPYIFIGTIASSFWISYLAKVYSWEVLLAVEGPVNGLLLALGVVHGPIPFLYTPAAVVLAAIQIEVPFATLIIYSAMRQVDREVIAAARTLGAGRVHTLRHAYWPQIRAGVVVAGLVVFLHTMGIWVVPAILGGPGEVMAGQQIASEIVNKIDPRMASVMGSGLAVTMVLVVAVALWLSGAPFHHLVALRRSRYA